jgi:hypothetical protein
MVFIYAMLFDLATFNQFHFALEISSSILSLQLDIVWINSR